MTVAVSLRAYRLTGALCGAVVSLASAVESPGASALTQLESRIDAVKGEWQEILDEITVRMPSGHTRRWAAGVNRSDYSPFFRALVALSGLAAACSGHICNHLGTRWGEHLFSSSDFPLTDFDPIRIPLSKTAIQVLVPDMAGDFWGAFLELSTLSVLDPKIYEARVGKSVRRIARAVGAKPPKAGLGLSFWSEADVQRELKVSTRRIAAMRSTRKLVFVESWTGEMLYPDFQFVLGPVVTVAPLVLKVLRSTPSSFAGWPLALWLSSNRHRSELWFQEALEARGLWKPSWSRPVVGSFDGLKRSRKRARVSAGSPLYRVCPSPITPFRFAQSSGGPVAGTPVYPGGRFDVLSARSGLGSLYLAETPEGAWSEVLDREPLVTLRHISMRDIWSLTPLDEFDVVDCGAAPALLAASPHRADTQDLATFFAERGHSGLRAPLRTGNGCAVVLFGAAGTRLPSCAGIGHWASERQPGLESAHLWSYLEARRTEQDLPVVLRRFPGEVRLLH